MLSSLGIQSEGATLNNLGRALALPARERGAIGADLVAGRLVLKPTVANVARLLRTSPNNIYTGGKPPTFVTSLARAWSRATRLEKQEFLRANLDAILAALDAATAPGADASASNHRGNGHARPDGADALHVC
jgi:hypothetical protein